MASKQKTIQQAQEANRLKSQRGNTIPSIAKSIGVSPKRVEEYLERNSHPLTCPICGGHGVNKQRSTGKKTPICR